MPIAGTDSAVRSTRQRAAVGSLLDEVQEFRTAQEIHALLRERGDRIGLTTVYRALQILAHAGEVDVLRGPDGEAAYRRCSQGHHHHLVCRNCARTLELELPQVERTAATVARQHGFVDVSHTMEVFGLCRDCSTATAGG